MRISGFGSIDMAGYDMDSAVSTLFDDRLLQTCREVLNGKKGVFALNVTMGNIPCSPIPCYISDHDGFICIHGIGECIDVFPTGAATIVKVNKKTNRKGE